MNNEVWQVISRNLLPGAIVSFVENERSVKATVVEISSEGLPLRYQGKTCVVVEDEYHDRYRVPYEDVVLEVEAPDVG